MKSKFFIVLISIFCFNSLCAEDISIVAKEISIDKDQNTTIFQKEVVVKTKNKTIKSNYVKYLKDDGLLIVKDNIEVLDDKGNTIEAEYAEYYEKEQILLTKGKTEILTVNKYFLNGEDIKVDNIKKISSKKFYFRG